MSCASAASTGAGISWRPARPGPAPAGRARCGPLLTAPPRQRFAAARSVRPDGERLAGLAWARRRCRLDHQGRRRLGGIWAGADEAGFLPAAAAGTPPAVPRWRGERPAGSGLGGPPLTPDPPPPPALKTTCPDSQNAPFRPRRQHLEVEAPDEHHRSTARRGAEYASQEAAPAALSGQRCMSRGLLGWWLYRRVCRPGTWHGAVR